MTSPAGSIEPRAPTGAIEELRRHWTTLAGATLGAAFGAAALPFYTAGLFITHLEDAFGWTRTELTAIGLATTLVMAAAAPLAGGLFDRIGILGPAAVGFVALAINFFYMSSLQGSLAQYAVIHILLAILMIGSGPIGLTRPVNMAFNRMRGLALGITIGGIGAMAAVAPPIVGRVIEAWGWRAAYQALGVTVLCVAPLALLLLSRRPPRPAPLAGAPAQVVTQVVTQGVAQRGAGRGGAPPLDGLFWRLVLSFTLVALAVSGFVTHFVPMLTDQGVPSVEAAGVAGLLGAGVLIGRLGVGYIVDHIFAPYVAAGVMLLTAVGLALLALGGPMFAAPGALAVGLAMGAEVDLIAYFAARYYGMRHYGRMYGLLYGAFLIGTGTSPYLIALLQAAAHSYVPALWLSAGLLTLAGGLFLTSPRFRDDGQAETTT